MFTARAPSDEQIGSLLERNKSAPFSYLDVGRTQFDELPVSYNIDRREVKLGSGESAFFAAKNALQRWTMFDMDWLRVHPQNAPVRQDSVVAVVASHFGFHSVNLCRIIYVEESGWSFRFAYGTLIEHAEMGEERFTISWDRRDDSVSYEILAFSRPRAALAKLGYPLSRGLQKRFARASLAAMTRAVSAA